MNKFESKEVIKNKANNEDSGKTSNAEIFAQCLEKLSDLNNLEYYDSGFESNVYTVDIMVNGGVKKILIIKSRKDTDNIKILEEYNNHLNALSLTKKEKFNKIKVPEIYGVGNNDGLNFIVMDYIEGKTMFSDMLSRVLKNIYMNILKYSLSESSNIVPSSDLKEKLAQINQETIRKDSIIQETFIQFFKQMKDHPIVNEMSLQYNKISIYSIEEIIDMPNSKAKEWKLYRLASAINRNLNDEYRSDEKLGQIQESSKRIKLMHQNNLFHNDLTPRNSVWGDDGILYPIDFGKANSENIILQQKNKFKGLNPVAPKKYDGESIEGDYRLLEMIDEYGTNKIIK